MALITDPDLLDDGPTDNGTTEVFINTTTKTIKLTTTGALSTDGVTLKALYSFLKEEWKNDPHTKNLAAFPFPLTPITDESYEFIEGWDMFNDAARYLIRTSGWTVRNTSGLVTQQWAGIIGLGSIEANDQLYIQQSSGGAATNIVLTGQVNQAVQILKDDDGDGNFAEGSDFDRRTYFTLFGREQAQVFGRSKLSDIGVVSMGPQAYRFPISTGADLKVTTADTGIKASGSGYPADVAPYSGMSITYHSTPQSRAIGTNNYNFGITVDGNGQPLQKIYEFIQYALRQNVDIAAGAANVIGKTADPLARYVGDTFYTVAASNPEGGGTGVWIANFATVDVNSIVLVDNTGAERTFPYTASLTINFNDNLDNDAAAEYWVYFTTLPGATNDFGESGAVLVQDADDVAMTGLVPGSSVTHTFDYDGNVQGGRTAGTDAGITVVAIGLATGQYVRATGSIQRSTSNSIALVAPLERTYANP
jgi:hypothetical protein